MLPSGATFFDLSFEFRTYVLRKTDPMGMVSYERTGFADRRTPDLDLSHAFGPIEAIVGAGVFARLGVNIATKAIPEEVSFRAYFYPRQRDGSWEHFQTMTFAHRLLLRPHELALYGSASATLIEQRAEVADGTLAKGKEITVHGGVGAEFQIRPWLCVAGGPSGGTPVYKSVDFLGYAGLSLSMSLTATTKKWDFFVDASLGDITRRPSTFLNFGFAKRWGL